MHKASLTLTFWKMWLDILTILSTQNGYIVVEGKHDSQVLENLYVPKYRIVEIQDHAISTIENILSARKANIILIFLDRDSTGKKKTFKLIRSLRKFGVETINIWNIISKTLQEFGFKSIKKVEELKKFTELLDPPNELIIRKLRTIILL